MLNRNDRDYKIAVQINKALTTTCYLRRDPLAIIDDLLFTKNIEATRKDILHILKSIQQFDSSRRGVRTAECLITIKNKLGKSVLLQINKEDSAIHEVLANYFEEFTKNIFINSNEV